MKDAVDTFEMLIVFAKFVQSSEEVDSLCNILVRKIKISFLCFEDFLDSKIRSVCFEFFIKLKKLISW